MSEENNNNSGTITIKKDDLWKYSTFLLAALVIVLAVFAFSGGDGSTTTNTGTPSQPTQGDTAQAALPEDPQMVDIEFDEAMLGEESASVVFVEYTDYQCPFCQRQFQQTIPTIKSEYVDNGQVRYYLKDFPLESIHPQATPAAEAAECVRAQGGDEAYWEMHDTLFTNQGILSQTNYESWAQELGYDISDCLDSNEFRSEVRADLQEGQGAGVTGTPGSFILMPKSDADIEELIAMQRPDGRGGWQIRYVENSDGLVGVRISGAFPVAEFQRAIEAGL